MKSLVAIDPNTGFFESFIAVTLGLVMPNATRAKSLASSLTGTIFSTSLKAAELRSTGTGRGISLGTAEWVRHH